MPMSPRLLRPRAAGGFDPRAISGLAVWYDAADTASVTLNSGNVSELRDKSGNGRHMAQSTAANQPAYVTAGQNGRNVIRPTGNPQHLRRESTGSVASEDLSYLGTTTHTLLIAHKASARTTSNYLFWAHNPNASTVDRLIVAGPWAVGTGYFFDSGDASNGRLTVTTDPGTTSHIATFRRDGSAYASWISGTAAQTAARASAQSVDFTGTFALFAEINFAGAVTSGYSGDLYEVIHYNRALTTDERQRVERYLGAKWNITVT